MLRSFLLLTLLLCARSTFAQVTFQHAYDSPDYKTFQDWLRKNIVYPDNARKKGIQGTVHVQFRLDDSFHIIPESVKVISGVNASFDEEALRVMKSYQGT